MTNRDDRMAELQGRMQALRDEISPLSEEWHALDREKAREEWPAGPFTLHYYRYGSVEQEEFDRPWEALQGAKTMSDYGAGAPEKITDCEGNVIYENVRGAWVQRADGYPEDAD